MRRFIGNQNCAEAVQLESAKEGVASMNAQKPSDGTVSGDIKLEKSTFSDFEYAFGTNHGTSGEAYKNIQVKNCTFKHITKYAICMFNYKNCVIKGNHVKNSRSSSISGLLLNQGSNQYTVR